MTLTAISTLVDDTDYTAISTLVDDTDVLLQHWLMMTPMDCYLNTG
jgi:hypothetical protein